MFSDDPPNLIIIITKIMIMIKSIMKDLLIIQKMACYRCKKNRQNNHKKEGEQRLRGEKEARREKSIETAWFSVARLEMVHFRSEAGWKDKLEFY